MSTIAIAPFTIDQFIIRWKASGEQKINEQGLVSILLQLHNELDAAVADAYGWPHNLSEAEILEKLVALNKERAAEEAQGLISWLRSKYQNPQGTQQTGMNITVAETTTTTTTDLPEWPRTLAEQAQAIQRIIQQYQHPFTAAELGRQFKKANKTTAEKREQQIGQLLETISTLGLLRKVREGEWRR